jgi:hypothetical protein
MLETSTTSSQLPRWSWFLTLFVCMVGTGRLCSGQNARRDPKDVVSDRLRSQDEKEYTTGLTAAIQMAATHKMDSHFAASMNEWANTLMTRQNYDDLDRLVVAGMIGRANDVQFIERFQTFRVRIKLAQNKTGEALAAAKALYDVASMSGTDDAIDTVCECLIAFYPKEAEIRVRNFRLQQVQGSSHAATRESVSDSVAQMNTRVTPSKLLPDIQVDRKPFENSIVQQDMVGKGIDRLVAKGNLYLLCDEPLLAEQSFRTAYNLRTDGDTQVAIEGIARSMRAEDGCVQRANAWVQSLQASASNP